MSKNYENAKYWALLVSIFLMLSKVLGFFRDVLIARGFGTSVQSDAYLTALTGIVIIVGAIGGGLQTTLVPVFSDVKRAFGRLGKNKYFSNVLSVTLVVSLMLAVLIYIFASPYAYMLAYGYEGEVHDLIVYLIRQGLPIVVFLGITYVSNAYLQSDEVYGPHALMGIPYNMIFIIYLLIVRRPSVIGIMYVNILATASQFLIQVPALRSRNLKFKFGINFRDHYLKRTFVLILPIVVSSTVYQINLLIDKTLASTLVEGSISALNYANKVNTLVISVFVVAITSVIFPKLTNAIMSRNTAEAGDLFASSINLVLLVTIPACVGLVVLSTPIIKMLFERGAFSENSTMLTSGALLYYAPGLVGQSIRMCLDNLYYSNQDTKTPMFMGILSVIINVILNFSLIGIMGHRGIALATSISSISTAIIMYFLARKKIKFSELSMLITMVKIFISGALMGLSTHFMWKFFSKFATSKIKNAGLLLVTILISIVVYIIITLILRVPDIKTLMSTLKRRFSK